MEEAMGNVFNKLENIKRLTKNGVEFCRARELQEILEYQRWDKFMDVIERAIASCESAGIDSQNHFSQTGSMVRIGSGAERKVPDYFLTRYACYLIAMNGDPNKPEIGFAQAYFAYQTRRQEVRDQLTGQEMRLEIRERVRSANKALNSAAKESGVTKYPFSMTPGIRAFTEGLATGTSKGAKAFQIRKNY